MPEHPQEDHSLVSVVAQIQRFANPDLSEDELARMSQETAETILARIDDLDRSGKFGDNGVAYVELDDEGHVVERGDDESEPHDVVRPLNRPEMPIDLKRLVYGCCFCEDAIEPNGVDPCALVLIGKWSGPEEEQDSQQFWCHVECFKGNLAPKIVDDLHVGDATHDEVESEWEDETPAL
jgi:hypothetical protein